MLKIYHNPRCSKSRAGLKFVQDNNLEVEIIEYLKTDITPSEIEDLVKKTRLHVTDLIRTHEDYYKKELKDKEFSDQEWYEILAEHPNLLHRPIIVKENKAILAQPPEKINELL